VARRTCVAPPSSRHGKKDYIKAVELYESGAILASNWELADDYIKIEETIRKTKIEDLKEKKINLDCLRALIQGS